jgi:hypothetical protein
MAITEKQKPSSLSSLNEPLNFVVSSDQTAQPNFKFIFELYRGATRIATFKRFPIPSTTIGVIDLQSYIRAYVNALVFKGSDSFLTEISGQDTFWTEFVVKYGEEYGSPVTSYLNLANSGTIKAYNYAKDIESHLTNAALSNYENSFLTSRETRYTIQRGERMFIPFWNNTGGSVTIEITEFNAVGLNNYTSLNSSAEYLLLAVGTDQINDYAGSSMIDSDSVYYTITVNEAKVFRFDLDCFNLYDSYHLVFLNRLAGFESVHFRGKSRKSVNVERKMFGKNPQTLHVSGADAEMKVFEVGSSNVLRGNSQTSGVKKQYKYRLTSGFLSDQDFEWMSELVCSPMIYLERDGNYLPVKITSSNYDFLTRAADKLNPLEIEVEVLKNYNTQFT